MFVDSSFNQQLRDFLSKTTNQTCPIFILLSTFQWEGTRFFFLRGRIAVFVPVELEIKTLSCTCSSSKIRKHSNWFLSLKIHEIITKALAWAWKYWLGIVSKWSRAFLSLNHHPPPLQTFAVNSIKLNLSQNYSDHTQGETPPTSRCPPPRQTLFVFVTRRLKFAVSLLIDLSLNNSNFRVGKNAGAITCTDFSTFSFIMYTCCGNFWVRKRKTCYYLTFALNIVQFSFGWTIKLNRFRPNNKSLINKLKLFLLAFFVSFRWAWYGKWLIRGWMKRIKLWIRPKVCQVRGPWTFVHCVRVNNAVGHGRELTWVRQCWWISRMDTGAR